MKFLFRTFAILLMILLVLKVVIYLFDDGHVVSYSVGNFKVNETFKTNGLYDKDGYYFDIVHEDFNMNFQLPVNLNKADGIISSLKYEKVGDMNCIMPIFKGGKVYTDIMCLSADGEISFYHNLGDDIKKSLSKFVSSIKKYGYNPDDYVDKSDGKRLSNTLKVYENNMVENHYVAVENYKGLSLFSDKDSNVKLFDNDVYTKPIKIFSDKYYIVADYNEEYSFKIFYVVNIINGNIKEIRSYNDISFDSVIQGYVDDDVYIFDRDAEVQYKVSLKYESVEKVAEKNNIKNYVGGKWGTMSLNDALNGKKFDNYYVKAPKGYLGSVCYGKDMGYCYYYKKSSPNSGDEYLVYRADVQNPDLKTYLFKTSDLSSVIYLNDYVYFRYGNTIYYYHNGIRNVLTDSEFEFNNDIDFGVYIK